MDDDALCRLCINICKDFKTLCDASGVGNEIYETTVKYFDPKILNLEREKYAVICEECWHHIDDFHHFQLSVIMAQDRLLNNDDNFNEIEVKREDMDSFFCDNNESLDHLDEDEKNVIQLPDIELFDLPPIDQFSSEDEKPLVERRTTRTQKNIQDLLSSAEKKLPKKRGRKPKIDSGKIQKIAKNKSKKIENSNKLEISGASSQDEVKMEENGNREAENRSERTSKEIDEYIAQWKQDLDCYICGETSKTMHLLRQHFRQNHPNTRCYVLCCQRKLSRRFQLEEHIRLHLDPAAFKCNLCGKCCTNKRTLSNHMFEQHTEAGQTRSYECPICHKRFAKKPVMKRHMEIHETAKDFVCKECGKGFPTEQRRNVHERTVHNSDHVCDQCGKTIHGIYALRQHVLEHAGVEKRKWSCDQCNAQLNTHASLKRHKQVAHHDGSTAYICSECGKVSATAFALRSHKKYVHQAKRKFPCSLCDKAFKTRTGMREHMATHTGEDLYTCPHCPRTFKVNSNMHHHRKKAHPKEWAEARMNKPVMPTIDVNQVTQEVVI